MKNSGKFSELGDYSLLYRYTVPIFNFDRAEPDVVGTGVLIRVDPLFLVATAAHVLEEGFRNIGFGFLKAGEVKVFGGDDMAILTARAQSGAGDVRRVVYKDGLDLALIEPTPDVSKELQAHYSFFDLRLNPDCPGAKSGVVSGWPARKNVYDRKKRLCNFDTCYHIQCPLADEKRMREAGWDRDIYLGLSVDKAKDFVVEVSGERIHLPKLTGMSGSGFWLNCEVASSEWCLAGIVIEDDEPLRMLKVIKIGQLWAPIRQWELEFPSLH